MGRAARPRPRPATRPRRVICAGYSRDIITIIIYVKRSRSGNLTLADLKPGDAVRIDSVDATDPTVQRLMVLGLVEGAEVSFLRASLGGDPLEFRLFGAAISLRRDQARAFHVSPVSAHV